MTNAQIKKAQIAQISKVLKASGNFGNGEALKFAAKLTYEAINTEASLRTSVQQMMINNLLRLTNA